MTLILPGVEIEVVKDIVVGQLNPSGVLGLIGMTEDEPDGKPKKLARASSYKGLRGTFGRCLDATIPEAKQAFQNGVSEIVMVPLAGTSSKKAMIELKGKSGETAFKVNARARGQWGNNIKVKVEGKPDDTGKKTMCTITVSHGNMLEIFDNLNTNPGHDRFIATVVNSQSDLVSVEAKKAKGGAPKPPIKKDDKAPDAGGGGDASDHELPVDFEGTLMSGTSPIEKDFDDALEQLEGEEDVDLVSASIEDMKNEKVVKHVYAAIEAHCNVLSGNCANRIGFGQSPPPENFASQAEEVSYIAKQTITLNSDRFIYTAPNGALGAVMGLVGNLPVHQSPTFKTLSGLTGLSRKYSPSQLKEMLKSNILLLEAKKGRGIIVEKGICTSGEQISVQRVADKSVRGTKMIGDLFIGTLNNLTGRAALKEKCTEFFLQMEKDGAIVPNADGSDPAFKVDVYATDSDISKGIVRVDIAVRPVRAIDYVYGTILVRA